MPAKRSVAALIFPGFELLDLYGPLEMLGMREDDFALQLVSQGQREVKSSAGPAALADRTLTDGSDYDILLIPGGMGTRREYKNSQLLAWIGDTARRADHVATVCTGSVLLAATGLIDGHRATTNKNAFGWVESTRPAVLWQRRARWVEDGKFLTSSGVSAGIDMSLCLISRLLGRDAAIETARWAEYRWHEDSTDDPFA